MDQKTVQKIKKEHQDHLLDELLREKAAVLTRASWAVEDVLEKMKRIETEIEITLSLIETLDKEHDENDSEVSRRKKMLSEEINGKIDEFNSIRQQAQLQYYYLIVTREALGLRRHEMVQKLYRIPDKKPKIRLKHGSI